MLPYKARWQRKLEEWCQTALRHNLQHAYVRVRQVRFTAPANGGWAVNWAPRKYADLQSKLALEVSSLP